MPKHVNVSSSRTYKWSKYRSQALTLYESGDFLSYRAIASALKINVSHVRKCALADNWELSYSDEVERAKQHKYEVGRERAIKLKSRGFSKRKIAKKLGMTTTELRTYSGEDLKSSQVHVHPKSGLACDVSDFTTYSHRVRYHTDRVYRRFKYILDPKGRRGNKGHLDHRLSVYTAYNEFPAPLPYALVAHPANLKMLPIRKNYDKGRSSSITWARLVEKIDKFEAQYGKVFMSVKCKNGKVKYRYNTNARETISNNIAEAASMTCSDLRALSRLSTIQLVPRVFRSHLKRDDYLFIAFRSIKGDTQKLIARNMQIREGVVSQALERMGLLTNIRVERARGTYKSSLRLVERLLQLKASGKTLAETAKALKKTKLQTLFIWLKVKG